ncbi:SAM-dependent methyltransferase [Actinomadura sp. 7K507]|uniref:SAM-dependent methyltransferase n=1 Tax=Actinomadura sp. 7K507 TaxID=2530365 RepID=UPI001404A45D|nr:SAM-dependent methyltransferase [Actinomadura sp. 7K507]
MLDDESVVVTSARVWNYLRGGNDDYLIDRNPVDEALGACPELPEVAVHSGRFVARALDHLVGRCGVGQVLDVGAGIPLGDALGSCTHRIAQRINPAVRVVYVDTDPLVLASCRALCCGDTGRGPVSAVEADVRDPRELLRRVERVLDLAEPVVVVAAHVLTHLSHEGAAAVAQGLVTPLATGSYLVVAEPMAGLQGEPVQAALDAMAAFGAPAAYARTLLEVRELLPGLRHLDPGVVPVSWWRPDQPVEQEPFVPALGGVGQRMPRGWWR